MLNEPIAAGDLVVREDHQHRQVIRVTELDGNVMTGNYMLPSGQRETLRAAVTDYRHASAEEVRASEARGQLP